MFQPSFSSEESAGSLFAFGELAVCGLLSGVIGWNRTIFVWLLCAAAGIICFLVSRVWTRFKLTKLI